MPNLSLVKIKISFKVFFMNWTDSLDIAMALDEAYPEVNPSIVNFVDLRRMIVTLDEFDDDANKSGEKILEAIQMNWIEEKE